MDSTYIVIFITTQGNAVEVSRKNKAEAAEIYDALRAYYGSSVEFKTRVNPAY